MSNTAAISIMLGLFALGFGLSQVDLDIITKVTCPTAQVAVSGDVT